MLKWEVFRRVSMCALISAPSNLTIGSERVLLELRPGSDPVATRRQGSQRGTLRSGDPRRWRARATLQTIAEKHRTISGRGSRPRHDVQWNANEAVDRLICFAFAASATTTYVRVWFTESGRLGGARIATHQPGGRCAAGPRCQKSEGLLLHAARPC